MSGRIDFTMGFNTQRAAPKSRSDNGFRIYILGNFSGLSAESWEQSTIRRIDIDNFDQVMSRIMPTLEIDSGLTLKFESIDDFHPDVLLSNIQSMVEFQKVKKELSNPATAAQAVEKIKAFFPADAQTDKSIQPDITSESHEDMLQRLLGKKVKTTTDKADSADRLIEKIISPYVKKDADPQHQVLIGVIDSMMSQFLHTLLHRQDFKNLEALWRATEALVNEENSDEQSFFLVDISQAELLLELRKENSTFTQKLIQHVQSIDGDQEILLVGDYIFSDSEDDSDLLVLCSKLAKACMGCFLGGADNLLIENSVFGEFENSQNWPQYLKEMFADSVMLAYPNYLLRMPYGHKRDPIETFEFEECSPIPLANELLWGNPSFICARTMIRISQGIGEQHFYFSDIPTITYDQDGEQMLLPGTESLLNETQANALLTQGIMPLIGFRQKRGIRLLALYVLSEHQ